MNNTIEVVEAEDSPLPKGFLARLPDFFSREGQTIYKGRNEIKKFMVDGRTVCVKKYGIPPFLNRIFYSWGLRTPKAKHAYENAREILRRGFQTPVQWGYVITRQNGRIGESYCVGEFVADARTVGQDRTDPKLVHAFAQYTADLHAHGLMHRDYILNNILYTFDGKKYHFTLIDINRFVFQNKPLRGFLQSMNLMQPFYNPAELKQFVQAYQQITHAPDSLVRRVLRFRWWRNRYSNLKRVLKKIPGTKRLVKYGK